MRLLIDAHVHVYPAFDPAVFLAAAARNLWRWGPGQPVLLLTETARDDVFSTWKSGRAPLPVSPTDEEAAIRVGEVVVVAGGQIITRERIEVHALATTQRVPDGLELHETIERVRDTGGLALLPWGVGKWFGRRGQRVAEAVNRHDVLLGDNAGRPRGWPTPGLFRGRIVLPGTDPLRMRSEQEQVGTYGFELEGDPMRPVQALRAMKASPKVLGQRVGPVRFLQQQVGLRASKR